MLGAKDWLQLRLLGGCEIRGGEETLLFESNKVCALLVYLAMNPCTHQRDKLIDLFWGDFPEAKARRNLRHALWNLRQQINLPDSAPILQADSQTVFLTPGANIWLDVVAFQDAVERFTGKQGKFALYALSNAMDVYRGDFLEGFHVAGASVFEEWALVECERLRMLALKVLQWLVTGYASQRENETALAYARHWLALSPWQEEAHRQMMRLLAATGQREAALMQYETCRQTLAAELGVTPDRETTQLYEQIKAESMGKKGGGSVFVLQPTHLPLPLTPFIGREKEFAEVSALLDDPACCLLTLTGPGGIGKTRLALQTASQKSVFSDLGVAFVPLVDLSTPQEILPAIVNELGFTLFGPQEPREQLLDFLREKQILLVLDNFEHLLEGAVLIREILDSTPSMKVLVTSRERLNLQGEWVYPLEGLKEPQAIQLFTQTARRLFLGLSFEGEESYLAQICRLVHGTPLALELAAAWVRVLSCQEIVTELESHQAATFLTNQYRDVPDRHRSLQAVFDHSWDLLQEKEKQVLMYLSIFRGGFHREAAEVVAGASLTDISILVDKSLLRRHLNGRYELHGLIRGFALEKLRQSGNENKIERKHAVYYSHVLATCKEPLRELLGQMGTEIENLRTAWRWAVTQREWDIIEKLHDKLYVFFEVQSAFQEGETFFRDTLETLTGVETPQELRNDEENLIAWKLLAIWSALTCRLGRLDAASESFSRCVDVFRQRETQKELAFRLFYLGDTTRLLGDLHQAQTYLQESLDLYIKSGNQDDAAFALNVLGLVAAAQGEHTEAKKLLEQSRKIFQVVDHPWGLAVVNINLGSLLKALQDYPAATALLQESLALCQELGHRWAAAVCLNHLGDLARLQGDRTEAQSHYLNSLSLHREIGSPRGIREATLRLATLLQEQEDLKRALVLLLIDNDPTEDDVFEAEIQERVAMLRDKLSEADYQDARELSRSRSIEEILEN
jgi:predicted ATPase/DNA-binding SARP family transcriptional activator/tetratricopeptide (TPR) repeat protein